MNRSCVSSIACALLWLTSTLVVEAQVPENGLVFDGDNDYVTVTSASGDELNPEYNLTLECWVNLNEAPSGGHRPHLITKYTSYGLAVESSGYARLFLYTDGWEATPEIASTLINPNRWYHLAATFDGITGRLYVNGREEATVTVNGAVNQSGESVRIGSVNTSPGNDNTNGMIDEVRIWNVTRTQAQIRDAMNRTIPGNTSGLVGYWRFDETTGTNADCETTHDNDGTLTNMSVPAAWQTSTAPMGENSIFAVSADITETSGCAVDVDFLAWDLPGGSSAMAVMQVNELPNSVSGLHPDRVSRYWEIWSEDPDFDGNFTAEVRFHYDGITGLPSESALKLFRRDDANGVWGEASGYTVVTNDGGSSTGSDGIGYVELTVTENTSGDFSGQYILSWSNEPPVVSNIPNQSVAEGSAFSTIVLDNYVNDPDHADSEIAWAYTGADDVSVVITNRVATITANDPNWNGTDIVTFIAEDPEGGTDSDQVTFEVTPVNDPPVVSDIPNQTIPEGTSFATINLDDYVTDIEDAVTALTWTASGQSDLVVDITGRVATIILPDANWNGTETISFRAEDTEGGSDSDQAGFTVTPVNDAPVVSDIPDQVIAEGQSFSQINLNEFVEDVDDPDSSISWVVIGASNLSVDIADSIATVTIDDAEWNGSDTLVFAAKDTSGAVAMDTSIFTVSGINDVPLLGIPIPDTAIDAGQAFSYVLDPNTFVDVDPGDSLVLSASMSKGGSTPAWISFDAASRTFSGTPADADSGLVEVIVTATDDSAASVADTFTIRVISYVGISNPLEGVEINLYPNPNHGSFVIESDRFGLKDVVLEIFNEQGQLIWNRKIMNELGTLYERVELDNAANGLYLLRVRNESGVINKRFVVSH